MSRNGNFCKGAKFLRRLKSTPVLNNKKSLYVCNGKFAVFWGLYCGITCKWVLFPTIDLYFYQLSQIVFACTVNTAIKVKRQCVSARKTRHRSWTSSVLAVFWFACAASNRANLAFKTTIIENTHLALIGFLSKVEANNSLFFLPLQTYEKKFAEIPFLFISIIPCFECGKSVVLSFC